MIQNHHIMLSLDSCSLIRQNLLLYLVGFKKEDCEGRRNLYNSDDIYNVVWDGEEYPQFCSLNFKIISSDSYELCAKVTQFNLECPDFKLKFYWGVKMNEKVSIEIFRNFFEFFKIDSNQKIFELRLCEQKKKTNGKISVLIWSHREEPFAVFLTLEGEQQDVLQLSSTVF